MLNSNPYNHLTVRQQIIDIKLKLALDWYTWNRAIGLMSRVVRQSQVESFQRH